MIFCYPNLHAFICIYGTSFFNFNFFLIVNKTLKKLIDFQIIHVKLFPVLYLFIIVLQT